MFRAPSRCSRLFVSETSDGVVRGCSERASCWDQRESSRGTSLQISNVDNGMSCNVQQKMVECLRCEEGHDAMSLELEPARQDISGRGRIGNASRLRQWKHVQRHNVAHLESRK